MSASLVPGRRRPAVPPTPAAPPSRSRSVLLLAAVLWAVAACGGQFSGGSAADYGTFRIDVTNDRAPRIEVYLVPEGGAETSLGPAPVEGTTTFYVEPEDPSASYRLRAELLGGEELLSEPFSPAELRGVTWVLGTNTLTPEGEGETN